MACAVLNPPVRFLPFLPDRLDKFAELGHHIHSFGLIRAASEIPMFMYASIEWFPAGPAVEVVLA
jgi:hypothetical protein